MSSSGAETPSAVSGWMKAGHPAKPPRAWRLIGVAAVAAMVIGCASASPSPSAATSTSGPGIAAGPSSSPSPSLAPSAVALASERPRCPNGHGGPCLGPLAPGTYSTEVFDPTITYTVPAGWGNYEDLVGNFLLIPPGGDLDGVDAGTSDYLGIYSSVAMPSPCTEPAPDLHAPDAIATYITRHPEFTTSNLHSVKVGGLSGVVLDIKLAKTWTKRCAGPNGAPAANLISGLPPSDFEHGMIAGLTIRLYLLRHETDVLAIEIDDALSGGAHFSVFDPIVKSLRFSTD